MVSSGAYGLICEVIIGTWRACHDTMILEEKMHSMALADLGRTCGFDTATYQIQRARRRGKHGQALPILLGEYKEVSFPAERLVSRDSSQHVRWFFTEYSRSTGASPCLHQP